MKQSFTFEDLSENEKNILKMQKESEFVIPLSAQSNLVRRHL